MAADRKGKVGPHGASDRGRKFGKRGRCPTCKAWHDRSAHWSHLKGKHKKGPRGGHHYKPIRSGEVARVPWWKGKGKSAAKKAAKRTSGGKAAKGYTAFGRTAPTTHKFARKGGKGKAAKGYTAMGRTYKPRKR